MWLRLLSHTLALLVGFVTEQTTTDNATFRRVTREGRDRVSGGRVTVLAAVRVNEDADPLLRVAARRAAEHGTDLHILTVYPTKEYNRAQRTYNGLRDWNVNYTRDHAVAYATRQSRTAGSRIEEQYAVNVGVSGHVGSFVSTTLSVSHTVDATVLVAAPRGRRLFRRIHRYLLRLRLSQSPAELLIPIHPLR